MTARERCGPSAAPAHCIIVRAWLYLTFSEIARATAGARPRPGTSGCVGRPPTRRSHGTPVAWYPIPCNVGARPARRDPQVTAMRTTRTRMGSAPRRHTEEVLRDIYIPEQEFVPHPMEFPGEADRERRGSDGYAPDRGCYVALLPKSSDVLNSLVEDCLFQLSMLFSLSEIISSTLISSFSAQVLSHSTSIRPGRR